LDTRIKNAALMVTVSMLSIACSMKDGASQVQAPKAQIGSFGLDLTTGDPSVKPGDDFFVYANGKWLSTFEIPPDKSSYGAFVKLADDTEVQVREIIEAAAAMQAPAGSVEQKVGDYYASFMDEAAIEAAGLDPLKPGLGRILNARDKKEIAALFGAPGVKTLFGVGVVPDLKQPDRYSLVVVQSGLGLPNRDYYLKDDEKLKDVREKYVAYIEQMLRLGEIEAPAKKAKAIMALETALAEVHWPIERTRDAEANYNPHTKAELIAYAPGFDWQTFFDALEIPTRERFVVRQTTAIRDAARLFRDTPLETLRAYLAFHYLSDHASYLPKRFDDAQFAFYGKVLRGQEVQRDRWKRAVSHTDNGVGELVGRMYVEKHFPPESKAKMEALVANLRAALEDRLEQLEWLSDDTRKRALEKLATFVPKIGYPDKWKDYSDLEVRRDDLIGNVTRAQVWDWRRRLARLDEPVDRDEWFMNPQRVNAYYNPLNNEIVFPAAILQPPFFDPHADDAVNYGAIGAVIGHEIGHGFDDQGRKFSADGSLDDWWTEADATAFTERTKSLIEQYSEFEALPGLKVNGAITIGENIGDLGGLNMALHAYRLSLNGEEAPVIDGLTGEQRFFLAWAQVWRAKYRDEALRMLVLSDPHSPPYFRVNGAVRNMDEWYEAFGVQPTDELYLPPENRVRIW